RLLSEKAAEDDPNLARRLAELRDEFRREVEERKRLLLEAMRRREAEALADKDAAQKGVEAERRDAAARLQELLATRDTHLLEAMKGAELVRFALSSPAPTPRRPGLWQRFLRFLAWLWRMLLAPLRWILSRTGLVAAPTARRPTYAVYPSVAGFATDLLGGVGGALQVNPQFRLAVKRRMSSLSMRERTRMLWRRFLGLEDYESIVRRLMADEMRREAETRDREIERRREELSQGLDRLDRRREDLERSAREAEERVRREHEEAVRRLQEYAKEAPRERLRKEVIEDLTASGLLSEKEGRLTITRRLVDRFASVVFEAEMRATASTRRLAPGIGGEGEGHLEKEPLLTVDEISHMDIVSSKVAAKMRHPRVPHIYDDDVVVFRERRAALTHAVLVLDASASMEEGDRMMAAKRALLALYQAVKRGNPANPVDVVLLTTSVRRVDLLDAWNARPRGFTNTGAALREARGILERGRADRRLLYVVTDGLPEAYTEDGEDLAGHPAKALEFALGEARKLRAQPGLVFFQVLLEVKDEQYVKAAEKIANEARGRVLRADAAALSRATLGAYDTAVRSWTSVTA
ncbi:MAG: VWA domain-containing protein, partial [Methanobacteriota archaeon]